MLVVLTYHGPVIDIRLTPMDEPAQPAKAGSPINLLSPGFARDPYPVYARLRVDDPVHLTPPGFAISTLLRRIPHLQLDDPENPEWRPTFVLRRLKRLMARSPAATSMPAIAGADRA